MKMSIYNQLLKDREEYYGRFDNLSMGDYGDIGMKCRGLPVLYVNNIYLKASLISDPNDGETFYIMSSDENGVFDGTFLVIVTEIRNDTIKFIKVDGFEWVTEVVMDIKQNYFEKKYKCLNNIEYRNVKI